MDKEEIYKKWDKVYDEILGQLIIVDDLVKELRDG